MGSTRYPEWGSWMRLIIWNRRRETEASAARDRPPGLRPNVASLQKESSVLACAGEQMRKGGLVGRRNIGAPTPSWKRLRYPHSASSGRSREQSCWSQKVVPYSVAELVAIQTGEKGDPWQLSLVQRSAVWKPMQVRYLLDLFLLRISNRIPAAL